MTGWLPSCLVLHVLSLLCGHTISGSGSHSGLVFVLDVGLHALMIKHSLFSVEWNQRWFSNHHHQDAVIARSSLSYSRHPSQSSMTLRQSSKPHPVSEQGWYRSLHFSGFFYWVRMVILIYLVSFSAPSDSHITLHLAFGLVGVHSAATVWGDKIFIFVIRRIFFRCHLNSINFFNSYLIFNACISVDKRGPSVTSALGCL